MYLYDKSNKQEFYRVTIYINYRRKDEINGKILLNLIKIQFNNCLVTDDFGHWEKGELENLIQICIKKETISLAMSGKPMTVCVG